MVIATFSSSDRTGTALLQPSRTATHGVSSLLGVFSSASKQANKLKGDKCEGKKKGTHWRIIRGETHVPVKMRALRKRRKMQVESLWRHEIPWVPRVLGGYCPRYETIFDTTQEAAKWDGTKAAPKP